MRNENRIPPQMNNKESFSRKEYLDAFMEEVSVVSEEQAVYALRKSVSKGIIQRVGRNQYTTVKAKTAYRYRYSQEARHAAEKVQEEYPEVSFQIFELIQLNAFVNHQIAHNVVFVYVENDFIDFVFDSLHRLYPGKVLLKPSADAYYRYITDDGIVVGRLPSESPKGREAQWHERIERILVDIAVDKLLSRIVPQGELVNIYETAYEKYLIDGKAMWRYARRKGAEEKLRTVLKTYAPEFLEDLL